MYYYFTSKSHCAIKLNGIYLGIITDTVKHVNVQSDQTLVELIPLNSTSPSFCFTLNSDFLSNPPSEILITDMKGGYLIAYAPNVVGLPFKVITQQNLENISVTVFSDGTHKISIQTQNDFFTENLNFTFDSVEILKRGEVLLVGFIGKECHVHGYKLFSKITPIDKISCGSFSFDNQITILNEYLDIAKHKVTLTLDVQRGELTQIDKKIVCSQNFSVNNLPLKIIPYAFLEELLVGGNIDCFLASNVLPNADKLHGFLGNFIGVMPPPFFVSPEQIGLIYKKTPNSFYVEYCSFELNGRLISGIKK